MMPIATTHYASKAAARAVPKKIVKRFPAAAKAATYLGLVEGAREAYQLARRFDQQHLTYNLRLLEDDPLYDAAQDWLAGVLPEGNKRHLIVSSPSSVSSSDMETPGDPSVGHQPVRPLRVFYTDNQTLPARIDGHKVRVLLYKGEDAATSGGRNQLARPERYIEFTCRTRVAQQAVLDHLESIHQSRNRRAPALYMATSWGGWTKRDDLPPRTWDSVVLPPAQKAAIHADLTGFLADEPRYNELAIPWHRGYLFEGPPGTGKTSLAKGLSHEFGLDLYFLSLSSLPRDTDITDLVRGVRPRSILLVEDVDAAAETHDREDATSEETRGQDALLNALDGVATPHGLIKILTTNWKDRLDPALLRPGRIDRQEHIGLPGLPEVEALYHRFYGQDLGVLPWGDNEMTVTPADVSEVFKRNLHDPDKARTELMHRLFEVPAQAPA